MLLPPSNVDNMSLCSASCNSFDLSSASREIRRTATQIDGREKRFMERINRYLSKGMCHLDQFIKIKYGYLPCNDNRMCPLLL